MTNLLLLPTLLSTKNPNNQGKSRLAAKLIFVALTYFASGRLGLAIPYVDSHITLIWLPTGIAVAAMLHWGYICWPGIFLGALVTNFSVDSSLLLDSSIALGNTLAPLLTVWLLRRLKFHSVLDRAYDILLLVGAAITGMTVSAGIGVSSLVIFKVLAIQDAGAAWLSWWAGDFVGVLLAAPLLLNISRAELKKLWAQRVEFSVWCLIMLAISWGVFFLNHDANSYSLPVVFVVLPLVVWSAMRFGLMGSSLGVLLPVLIAAWATRSGVGPFDAESTERGLFLLWLFFATLVLVELMVSALQAGRKLVEVALQQSEQQLRAIIEAEPECVKLLADDGTVLQMNPAGLRMLGADSPEQIIGQKALGIVAPQYRREFAALMRRVFEGESGNLEFEAVGLKGVHCWLETYAVPMRDAQGKITALLGVTRDITERKLTQMELQHSQDLLNEAQRLGKLGSWELNLLSGELRWSDEVYRIFELDPARFSPSYENFLGILHPDDRDKVNQAYTRSLEDHQPYDIEHRLQLADGRVKWVHEHCTSEFDVAGKPLRSVGAVQDVTEQHILSEQLRVAAVTFNTQEAILISDPDAKILRVNQAFQEITGYHAEEVIGQNPRLFQSGRHDAAFYQAMWTELLGTGKWSGEVWDKRKNGDIYPKAITITAVYGDQRQVTHYVAVFRDISNRKQSEQEIYQLAFYDPLTHLPNRRLLLDRLQHAMVVSLRNDRHGALLFLDLDHFKNINDTQGHAMGDRLLMEVARRLQSCVREGDSVARLGGDEFVVVLEGLSNDANEAASQTEMVAEKIRSELGQSYLLKDYECLSTASIGISLFCGLMESAENLLMHADVAMYQAKLAGRNAIRFFDPEMQTVLDQRASMEKDLHHALGKQQFHLFYQIQVDSLRRPLGAEVLLRWDHPERGMVSPVQFIPLAEETGLIVPIGLWVIETACVQLKVWQSDALTRDLTLAVNVSAKQFRQPDFVAQVQRVLLESGAKPSKLKLELTESIVLENVEDTISKMSELKLLGVSFSMDDFGTGYSSLQYLKRLPLDQIKIDQSFVRDITSDTNDAAIVQTIIAMTEALGLNVIAEGVETQSQLEFLELRGCHAYQGYLFSKPVPLAQFEALLHQR